jgi:DNA invertase Pin-like site-specific DNA recombinase
MIGILAEAERAMIRERVQAGINRARGAGKRLGRPKIDAQLADAIRAALASGLSIRRAAKLHGVGVSTVQRLKAASRDRGSGDPPGMRPVLPTNPIADKSARNVAAGGAV